RLSPDGAAEHAAREAPEQRSRLVRVENDGRLRRRYLPGAELSEGPACRLLPHELGVLQAVEVAIRGPVVAASLLSAFVFDDRRNAERGVRASLHAGEPAREHEHPDAAAAGEGGALAQLDARIEREGS